MSGAEKYHRFDYRAPLDDLAQFMAALPEGIADHVRAALKDRDRDAPKWPAVPYCYAQGIIPAYDEHLASLPKDKRLEEMTASRLRYAEHYRAKLAAAKEIAATVPTPPRRTRNPPQDDETSRPMP